MNIHKNTVKMLKADVNTTTCAAKSLSPSIFWAIVNEDTAVGEANINRIPNKSIPLNPISTLIGIIMPGSITNLPRVVIVICLKWVFTSLNAKEPPRRIRDKGVAILEISLIDFSKAIGSFKV